MDNKAPIFVSLDTTSIKKALSIISALRNLVAGVKIGKEFFTKNGPQGVHTLTESGIPFFLDLKFHDIPNTVARAIEAASSMQPAMINVHTSGGSDMMKAAAKAVNNLDSITKKPILLGVTILTSLSQEDIKNIGFYNDISQNVLKLANLAQECGLDGVVCSPKELTILRKECGPNFKLVTPGIRLESNKGDDQKRFTTPSEALDKGADIIIIGRPITSAPDPVKATIEIINSLK